MVKIFLILMGFIVICALIGTGVGHLVPAERTIVETLVNYRHRGEFHSTAYSTLTLFPGESPRPAPVLFPHIIEEIEMLFSYSGYERGEVEIQLILEDRGGNWLKEIPIETTGVCTISFPLNLPELFELGRTITEQLGGRGRGYLLRIIAEVETEGEPFISVLEGELDPFNLSWEEDGFYSIQRGFPGGDDWRLGAFGYRVKLKDNVLFGPITLERRPDLSIPEAADPDAPLYTHFIESVEIGFNYRFISDARIKSLTQEVELEMVVADPGRWSRSFTLIEPTKKQGEFTLNSLLDVDKLREMADSIGRELGHGRVEALEITMFARVHTIAETEFGIIDEAFSHQLRATVGDRLEWRGVGGEGPMGLLSTREGTITREVTEPNLVVRRFRMSSLIGLGISLPIFGALAAVYWTGRPKTPKPSFLKKDLQRNRKKYGELISEVSDAPSIREGEVIIRAYSLEALANISNNSLKPILLKVEPDRHTYYVIDGSIRYEYVSKLKLRAKEQDHQGDSPPETP